MGRPQSKTLESEWAARVSSWRASGLTAREYSEREGIGISSLFNWARRLDANRAPRLVQLVPTSSVNAAIPRAESRVVVCVGDVRIEVSTGFDPGLLADVIASARRVAR